MYADCCDDARETFTYLEQYGVGAKLVGLYQAWAYVLEHYGDHKEAERVFETGTVTLDSPKDVEQLEKIRLQYRERVAESARRRRDEPDEEPEAGAAGDGGRAALGDVRKSKRGRVATNRAPIRSRGGLASRADESSRSRSKRGGNGNGGGIQVFEDPEGKYSARNGSVQVFSDLPQEAHVSKENARSASTWKGGIGTKAKVAAPVEFAVFQDESADLQADQAAARKPAGSNRRNFERKALGNYKPKAPVVLLKDFAREQGTTRNVVGGYLKYDPVPIYGAKEEFSFEEIRGNAWHAQQEMLRANDVNELDEEMDLSSAPSPAHVAVFADDVDVAAAAEVAPMMAPGAGAGAGAFAVFADDDEAEAAPAEVSSFDATQQVDPKQLNFDAAAKEEEEEEAAAAAEAAEPAADEIPAYTGYGVDSPPMKSASSGEVTIHTKAAMADVMAMFASESSGDASFMSAPAPAPAAKEEPVPAAGGFEVFVDDEDENIDENQENNAPSAYAKPTISAAQQAAILHNADRGVLQAVPGFGEAEAVAAPFASGENAPVDDENAAGNSGSKLDMDFSSVMKSVGFGLKSRGSSTAAAAAAEAAAAAPPMPTIAVASASSSFACFEDPPTGKVTLPVEMSFVASTPFGRAAETITEKPMITPIQTEQASSVAAEQSTLMIYNDEDESDAMDAQQTSIVDENSVADENGESMMTPILEVSNIRASAPLGDISAADASSAWPPASKTLTGLMAHVDFANAGNCMIAPRERLPALDVDQSIELTGIAGEVTILTVDSETSTSKTFLGEIADDENVIIKTASPPCPWEFHVLTTLHNRLQTNPSGAAHIGAIRRSFPAPLSVHCYNDSHMFALEYLDSNTLDDVIQLNVELGKDMTEELVMFYTIEMLKIMEGMHAAKIVHGKFDAAAMKLRDDEYDGSLAIVYNPAGKGGWATKGLRLTDFDHGVDFERMPAGQQLTCHAGTWEGMAEYPSWTYQIDYHGLCSTVHKLLHRGDEMEVVQSEEDGSWAPAKTFKRYWKFGLWEQLFASLLNVGAGETAPLASLRLEFESFFAKNPYKAKGLKQALLKQEAAFDA